MRLVKTLYKQSRQPILSKTIFQPIPIWTSLIYGQSDNITLKPYGIGKITSGPIMMKSDLSVITKNL